MKYILIWMLCLGVACGIADEEDSRAIAENPIAALIFAPAVMVVGIFDALGD